jgi:hypothetical protein
VTAKPADMPTARNTAFNHEITLGEEEISDVSLATFYVFDKENAGTLRSDIQCLPEAAVAADTAAAAAAADTAAAAAAA